MEGRTKDAVADLIHAYQGDTAMITVLLQEAREQIATLEESVRGINGTSTFLRSQCFVLDKMVDDLSDTAEAIAKKLTHGNTPPISVIHGKPSGVPLHVADIVVEDAS